MRATPLQRQANQLTEELREVIERVALEELQSLWENVYDSLQQLDQQRPGIVRKLNVAKALTATQDMWELFRNRLKSRLLEELSTGALTLYGLMSTKYLPDQPLNFSSEQFAKEYEPMVGDRITLTLNTIKRRVGRKVVGWYNTPGMTLDRLVTQLQSDFGLGRATLIAKNEITELHSEVQARIADTAGITEWWWSTKRDQLVCVRDLVGPDGATYKGCRELHGKVFKIGMPMPPRGSHIGCILPGQIVAVPGLAAATKSFYRGRIIEILTASGRKIAVTPNHPILTSRGFIPADLIHEGDKVIAHCNPERIVSCIQPHYHHIPSVVEQVFSSLNMSFGMMSTRMPASPEYFHGDARFFDGDINIVYVDRKLTFGNDISFSKPVDQFQFGFSRPSSTNIFSLSPFYTFLQSCHSSFGRLMSSFQLVFFLLRRHFRPFQSFGFGLGAGSDMVVNQNMPDRASHNSKSFSGLLFRNTRKIDLDNFFGGQFSPSRNMTKRHSRRLEDLDNSFIAYPKLALDFCNRESAFIISDEVIRIKRDMYSGHVYDLQSDLYSLYTCNDIIVSNCRCTAILIAASAIPGANNE